MKPEFFNDWLWNKTLGVWYIYILVMNKWSSFHHNLIVWISSITLWYIMQDHLHISILDIQLCYLPVRMVEFPSYPVGLIFFFGITCCNKKRSLTIAYAYFHTFQVLLFCAFQISFRRQPASHFLFFTHLSKPTKRKGNVRERFVWDHLKKSPQNILIHFHCIALLI